MNICRKIFTCLIFLTCLSFTGLAAAKEIDNSKEQISITQAINYYPQFPWKLFANNFQNNSLECNIGNLKISLLKGGFSSDGLFKVYCSSESYVLRFMGDSHSLERRKIITESSKWAGIEGFAPKIRLIDSARYAFIVSDFLDGRTLELIDTKNSRILIALGRILSKVHNAPLPKKDYQEFSQFTYGKQWYESTLSSSKIVGPSVLKKAYVRWLELSALTNISSKKVMLHNDPNLRNILWHDDKIALLDWELAGIGDSQKEVAHVIAWYGMDNQLTNIFLEAYYAKKPTSNELEVLQKLKIQILLEFAWVGLSTLKDTLDQVTWDELYKYAAPKHVEDLSIIQMSSENKPSEEKTRALFLGLIKQFMIETNK